MGIAIAPREVLAERWADGMERAAKDYLLNDSTHEQISWGLACVRDGAYTLTRRGGRALSCNLPGALCEVLGLRAGDRVVYDVTERGTVEMRRVTVEDLPEFARAAAERADWLLAQSRGRQMLKHFENECECCMKLYCAQSPRSRFCSVCLVKRQRAQWREYWHRKGKQTPSYRRLLKRAGFTEQLTLPVVTTRSDDTRTECALVLS